MKRVLAPSLPKPGKPVLLAESEANHVVKVLRLRNGDLVEVMDGRGGAARATLKVRQGSVELEHVEAKEPSSAPAEDSKNQIVPVVLELAVLKGDAMEWAVEKAVELGVRTLVPVLTAHTVVQVKGKGPEAFQERWQKIADQALKQCGRLERLQILLPTPLENLLAENPGTQDSPRLWFDEAAKGEAGHFIAWLLAQKTLPKGLRVLIGPEGGWSMNEREQLSRSGEGTLRTALGPLVLRAETAALAAVSVCSAIYRSRATGA